MLITGGTGFVGSSLATFFQTDFNVTVGSRKESAKKSSIQWNQLDVSDKNNCITLLKELKPRFVIHCAGNKDVRSCEKNPQAARLTNAVGTSNIAEACKLTQAKMIYISTDLVFSSDNGQYKETEIPHSPLVYGQTKYEGEILASEILPGLAICRSAGIYGSESPLLHWFTDKIKSGEDVECFTDIFNTPTLVDNLGEMIQAIIDKNLTGIFHTVGSERVNRFNFFNTFAEINGLDTRKIKPSTVGEKKNEMLLRPDSSLDNKWTVKTLGVKSNNLAEGFTRLKSQGRP